MGVTISNSKTAPTFSNSGPTTVGDSEAERLLSEKMHPEWFTNGWYVAERNLIAQDISDFNIPTKDQAAFTIYWLSHHYGIPQLRVAEGIACSLNKWGRRWTASAYRFAESHEFDGKWLEFTGQTKLLPYRWSKKGKQRDLADLTCDSSDSQVAGHTNRGGIARKLRQLSAGWSPYTPSQYIAQQFSSRAPAVDFLKAEVRKKESTTRISNLVHGALLNERSGLSYSRLLAGAALMDALFEVKDSWAPRPPLARLDYEDVWDWVIGRGRSRIPAPKDNPRTQACAARLRQEEPELSLEEELASLTKLNSSKLDQ